MARSRLSILSNASSTQIIESPYPYIVVNDAVDKDLFAQLASEYPDPSVILAGREKKDTWYDYPACLAKDSGEITPLWKQFLAYHVSNEFYQDVVEVFGEVLSRLHPRVCRAFDKEWAELSTGMRYPEQGNNRQNHQSDVSMECQFYINYTEQPRAVRGPHVDRPSELYAALLYFRDPEDNAAGGNLDICCANDPSALYPEENTIKVDELPMEVCEDKIKVVNTARYQANTLVFFLNSEKSLHAVSPRAATPIARRHVNFTADLFTLPAPGLFNLHHTTRNRVKQKLENTPFLWRVASLLDH